MSFDWEEYLIHAIELSNPEAPKCDCSEALLRSCISRAYYSVFIRIRNKLQDRFDRDYDRDRVHEYVRRDLNTIGNSDLSKLLLDMSMNRNKADYDNSISKLPKVVENQLTKAEAAKKLLKSL